MSLPVPFLAAAASLPGRAHARLDRRNQDACAFAVDDDLVLAAVADGCSESPASELGAQLAARFLVVEGRRRLRAGAPLDELPDLLVERLVRQLRRWAAPLLERRERLPALVADCFLFTCQVAALTPAGLVLFGVGDGVVSVDGRARVLPAPEDGRPDYPAYRLLPADALDGARRADVVVHARRDADEVTSIVVATDGAAPLVEDLPALEAEPRLDDNPGLLQKRLRALARRGPPLEDDTTLVVLRRRRPDPSSSGVPPCA